MPSPRAATRNRAGALRAGNLRGELRHRSAEVWAMEGVAPALAVQVGRAAAKREQVARRSRALARRAISRSSIARATRPRTALSLRIQPVVADRDLRWPSRSPRQLLSTARKPFATRSIRLAAAPLGGSKSKMEPKWVTLGKPRSKPRAMAAAARRTTRVRLSLAARTRALTSSTAVCRRVDPLAPYLRRIASKRGVRIAHA